MSLDALVIDGQISPDNVIAELGLSVNLGEPGKEARLVGSVKGGGPTITSLSARSVGPRLRGSWAKPKNPCGDAASSCNCTIRYSAPAAL